MSRFAKGMSPGRRVQQGDVIGYVGTTGRSTGPHLHYEVLRDDSQINPMSVKQPPNTQLAGADLQRFGSSDGSRRASTTSSRVARRRSARGHDSPPASRAAGPRRIDWRLRTADVQQPRDVAARRRR